MAVYKEGYMAVEAIEKKSVQIFDDAADFGAPTKKGDNLWKLAMQMASSYGKESTRDENKYSTGSSVSIKIELLDEGAVMDERKTMAQALDRYQLDYVTCTKGQCKGYDGFLTITKL
jgi:hypothetical protein